MPETYYDSAEGERISKARAMRELATHGCDTEQGVADFVAECGDLPTYDAQAVLRWLGY